MPPWVTPNCDSRQIGPQAQTPDLYRVNFEVNNLKPFACLAFPLTTYLKTPRKQPIFGDELVTSFPLPCRKETITGTASDGVRKSPGHPIGPTVTAFSPHWVPLG